MVNRPLREPLSSAPVPAQDAAPGGGARQDLALGVRAGVEEGRGAGAAALVEPEAEGAEVALVERPDVGLEDAFEGDQAERRDGGLAGSRQRGRRVGGPLAAPVVEVAGRGRLATGLARKDRRVDLGRHGGGGANRPQRQCQRERGEQDQPTPRGAAMEVPDGESDHVPVPTLRVASPISKPLLSHPTSHAQAGARKRRAIPRDAPCPRGPPRGRARRRGSASTSRR